MKLLVVDDNRDVRNFLKSSLEAELFCVDIAEDGEKGLYLASINNYAAVLLSNSLPNKSGLEVCQELRDKGKNVRIMVMSAGDEAKEKAELLNAGADDHINKPFSFTELIARIRALMRRPQHLESEVLMAHDLMLDTRGHTVSRGRKEITLTRKEFMLLEYLMRNKGNVLSRGKILEHVWDTDTDPFSNTIEAHVVSLRRKVDLPYARKLIATVSGFGYKILG